MSRKKGFSKVGTIVVTAAIAGMLAVVGCGGDDNSSPTGEGGDDNKNRGELMYCNWSWNEGSCNQVYSNDKNTSNPSMTNLESCIAWGRGGEPGMGGVVSTCNPPPTPPEVRYYCDYTSEGAAKSDCWEVDDIRPAQCPDDSCEGRTELEHCRAGVQQMWAKLVTCEGANFPTDGRCCF